MSPKSGSPVPLPLYLDGSTPRVCIVGAGLSGLCAAIQLKRQLGNSNFVIFEKEHDIGGVWLVNTYPGCQVDIPGILYSFSFAPNPSWSKLCPDRDEVLAYIKDTSNKYDIYQHTQFGTTVDSVRWSEDSKTWFVTMTDLKTNEESVHEFNIVILGTGPLSVPKKPPEFESFTGPKMHSAEWDANVKLENQIVGVVGTGSSAVQVIPNIAPKAKKLIVYMREPNYVFPKPQVPIWWLTPLLKVFPFLLWTLRALMFLSLDWFTGMYKAGSRKSKAVRFLQSFSISRAVKDKNMRKLLMPRYEPGFKVPAAGYKNYYQAYNRPNVELSRSRVAKIEGQNVTTEDGRTDRLDVLILCTGFKLQDHFAPMRVFGAGGVDLLELWKKSGADTFYGVTCAEAPNLFFIVGPNGVSSHGSTLFMIECQVTFIINALREFTKRGSASIRVRPSAQAESMLEIREGEQKRAYMHAGPPEVSPTWLLNENGHSTVWPKSSVCYWRRTRKLDPAKFEFSSATYKMCLIGSEKMKKYRIIEDIVIDRNYNLV